MTTHEFDLYCETVGLQEPPYHEQVLVMQEFEEAHELALKKQGAIEALQNLALTLSVLLIRKDVEGDYFFGLHDALEITKDNLFAMKGGVI